MAARRSRSIKKVNKPKAAPRPSTKLSKPPEDLADLERIYGKQGVPDIGPVSAITAQNVLQLPLPPKRPLDPLGELTPEAKAYQAALLANAGRAQAPSEIELDESKTQAPKHRVTILKEPMIKYPELWISVHVTGPANDAKGFPEMFARANCYKAKSLEESDLVVFTGGPDVDPVYYGEARHHATRVNPDRDAADIDDYLKCLELGIPMFGVCRGAQFLHVMNGGKLYQHVDGHYGSHRIFDIAGKTTIPNVSSVHHQMCIANKEGGMEVLACTKQATERWLNDKEKTDNIGYDVEAFFYRDTCCLGVQGHPEYAGHPEFTKWVLDMIGEKVCFNPDLKIVDTPAGKFCRLPPDDRAMKDDLVFLQGLPPSITAKE